MMMRLKLILGTLVVLATLYSAEAAEKKDDKLVSVEWNKNKGGKPDALEGTDLTPSFCFFEKKACKSAESLSKEFEPTFRQCFIECRKSPKCMSVSYTAKDKTCYKFKNTCKPDAMKSADVTTYMRLKKGETCPKGKDFVMDTEVKYTNLFCRDKGKKCPGNNLYRKAQNIPDTMKCLLRCAKMKSCSSVDFDSKCYPKNHACSEKELEKDDSTTNYIRLESGVYSCPRDTVLQKACPSPCEHSQIPAVKQCSGGLNIVVAHQSSTHPDKKVIGYAHHAIDGRTGGDYYKDKTCTLTGEGKAPWITLDFGCSKTINDVQIFNSKDFEKGLTGFAITVTKVSPPCEFSANTTCAEDTKGFSGSKIFKCSRPLTGRYLSIRAKDSGKARSLSVCEIKYNVNKVVDE